MEEVSKLIRQLDYSVNSLINCTKWINLDNHDKLRVNRAMNILLDRIDALKYSCKDEQDYKKYIKLKKLWEMRD